MVVQGSLCNLMVSYRMLRENRSEKESAERERGTGELKRRAYTSRANS